MVADIMTLVARRDDLNYHNRYPKASRCVHKALVTSSIRLRYYEYGLVLAGVYGIQLDQDSCPLRPTAVQHTHASEFWFRQELVKGSSESHQLICKELILDSCTRSRRGRLPYPKASDSCQSSFSTIPRVIGHENMRTAS